MGHLESVLGADMLAVAIGNAAVGVRGEMVMPEATPQPLPPR